jgi:heterodisulfide reductase subunit C
MTVTAADPMRVADCYQCGKCTAGCPVAARMDRMPNQIVRMVQMGDMEGAMACAAMWECVSCQTCTTRCPKSVDCAGVMDMLRALSAERPSPEQARHHTILFQHAFLKNIRRHGRLNELELVGTFKAAVFAKNLDVPFLFKDALLAPRMLQRGKLKLAGGSVQDREVVGRIFDRCLRGTDAQPTEPRASASGRAEDPAVPAGRGDA